MKIKSLKLLWVLFLPVCFLATGTELYGQNADIRKVDAFDEVKVFGNMEVVLEAGEVNEVVVMAEASLFSEVKTEVRGKTLKVSLDLDKLFKEEEIKVVIVYTTLRELSASAGSRVSSKEALEGDKLVLNAYSGGEIQAEISVNTVDLNAGQGGKLYIRGKTKSQDSNVNMGGELHAFDLHSEDTFVKLYAGGTAEVTAIHKIEASVSMGGIIRYQGDPEEVTTSTSLGGTISRKKSD